MDREASQKERAKDQPCYKDNDFLQDGVKITIGNEAKDTVMNTLNADVAFLARIHVMGYSLIFGVHNLDIAQDQENLLTEKDPNEEDNNGDNEDNDDNEDDEDPYDSGGSGPANPLTPPDSPPFQVSFDRILGYL